MGVGCGGCSAWVVGVPCGFGADCASVADIDFIFHLIILSFLECYILTGACFGAVLAGFLGNKRR